MPPSEIPMAMTSRRGIALMSCINQESAESLTDNAILVHVQDIELSVTAFQVQSDMGSYFRMAFSQFCVGVFKALRVMNPSQGFLITMRVYQGGACGVD